MSSPSPEPSPANPPPTPSDSSHTEKPSHHIISQGSDNAEVISTEHAEPGNVDTEDKQENGQADTQEIAAENLPENAMEVERESVEEKVPEKTQHVAQDSMQESKLQQKSQSVERDQTQMPPQSTQKVPIPPPPQHTPQKKPRIIAHSIPSQNVISMPQSIYATMTSMTGNSNASLQSASPSTFRTKDIVICLLCLVALLVVLYTQSNVTLVPFMDVTYASQSSQDSANQLLSPSRLVTHSSSPFVCIHDAEKLILIHKQYLQMWRNNVLRTHQSSRSRSPQEDELRRRMQGDTGSSEHPILHGAFFQWIQEHHPNGFQRIDRAAYANPNDNSPISIASVSLAARHLFVFFDDWSVRLYEQGAGLTTDGATPNEAHFTEVWNRMIVHDVALERLSEFRERHYGDIEFLHKHIQYVIGRPQEVVIKILESHKIQEEDQGLIIIGARKKSYLRKLTADQAKQASSQQVNNKEVYQNQSPEMQELIFTFEDPFVTGSDDGEVDKVSQKDAHFSYYAFDIRSGQLRWKHESEDFHYSHGESVHPQHNYKVDANQHLQHTGEVHWRHYKEDIMFKALPHVFRHERDTLMVEAHFKPSVKRNRRSSVSSARVDGQHALATHPQYGQVGDRLHSVYDNYKETRALRESSKNEIPNVLIIHQSQGIEVIHIYTGRTLCQVAPLKKNVAYGELNHDGSINSAESVIKTRNVLRGDSEDCIAEIESGSRGNSEVVFSTSICSIRTGLKRFGLNHLLQSNAENIVSRASRLGGAGDAMSRALSNNGGGAASVVVPPAILQRYDGISFKMVNDVVFLVSSGLATCITSDTQRGQWRVKWQVETLSSWETGSGVSQAFFPHVASFRMRESERDSYVVLVGQHHVTVLDIHGNIQQVLDVPGGSDNVVVAPVQFDDVDDDGLLDVVLETDKGVFVFVTSQRAGTSVLSFLLVALVMILGTMYLSTNVDLELDPSFMRKSKEFSE